MQEGLQALGIALRAARRASFRGFDCYTGTTFGFKAARSTSTETRSVAGGATSSLAEEMGGPSTPGIGLGAGIERLVFGARRGIR